ncbi:MAG: hypothetical protein M0Z94_13595 [Dehalococcoidales bacterium]|nr:hypothetical protein [Dehalococcoidales bacterium]
MSDLSLPRQRAMAALRHRVPDVVPAHIRRIMGWERHAAYMGVGTLPELLDHLGNSIAVYVPAYGDLTVGEEWVGLPPIWGLPEEYQGTYTDSLPRPLAAANTIADIDAFGWPANDK